MKKGRKKALAFCIVALIASVATSFIYGFNTNYLVFSTFQFPAFTQLIKTTFIENWFFGAALAFLLMFYISIINGEGYKNIELE